MEIKEIQYGNYGKCLSISNGILQAVVTIDVGPRIISLSRLDAPSPPNILFEDTQRKYTAKGKAFDQLYGPNSCYYTYGGHRLWLSPEDYCRTYYPDNSPVIYSLTEEGISFSAPQEHRAIQTEFMISMGENSESMMVIHTGKNVSEDMQTASLWAITLLRAGGFAIVPQNPKKDGNLLLPNRTISLWNYTDLHDPRLCLGNRYLLLHQQAEGAVSPQLKIGTDCHEGWCLYRSGDLLFEKRYVHDVNAIYPDGGASFEGFVTADYLALETLSPLYRIAPGDSVRHVENFTLGYRPNLADPDFSDEASIAQWIAESRLPGCV